MPLVELDIPIERSEPPPALTRLIQHAACRIDLFLQARRSNPVAGFVASDFPLVYDALRTILQRHLAPGRLFCEWGSGFGVVASMAALLGFDASGIEIESELVQHARKLAADFEIPVEFIEGSFIPRGGDTQIELLGELHWLETGQTSAYEQMDLQPDDFDTVFAYPWPGEEEAVYRLFERYAATGAILVTYHGVDELRIHRKSPRRRR